MGEVTHMKNLLVTSSFILALLFTTGLSAQIAPAELGGTSWQLIKFQGGDDTILKPDLPSKYTIGFQADGRVSARIDCNRGSGTWTSTGQNQIQFGPLALTRMMCPPGSNLERIARDWQFFRSYVIKNGHLSLSLMADGG